jgi:hypothetical protein
MFVGFTSDQPYASSLRGLHERVHPNGLVFRGSGFACTYSENVALAQDYRHNCPVTSGNLAKPRNPYGLG